VIDYHPTTVGPGKVHADHLQEWFEAGAADGFWISPDIYEDGVDAFVDEVVSELRSRGIFPERYMGATLRENLGVPEQYGLDLVSRTAPSVEFMQRGANGVQGTEVPVRLWILACRRSSIGQRERHSVGEAEPLTSGSLSFGRESLISSYGTLLLRETVRMSGSAVRCRWRWCRGGRRERSRSGQGADRPGHGGSARRRLHRGPGGGARCSRSCSSRLRPTRRCPD
jgi:hypothetical protein